MERQSRGGTVQTRVEGRRRKDAWDHHGPELKVSEILRVSKLEENTSCECLRTLLVFSLRGEELYRSMATPLPPLLDPPLRADSSNNGAQQSSPNGSLSCCIPRAADWSADAIYDCIRLHKQATHNVLTTKEAQSSILHVDHFPFNLFCLAEARDLIKDKSNLYTFTH